MVNNKTYKVLYLTYDGILDALGASQIMPYIYGIAKQEKVIHIVSFEKPEKYIANSLKFKRSIKNLNIFWTPLRFTSELSILGKVIDLLVMLVFSLWIVWRKKIDVIHARGHISAEIGLILKLIFKIKLIFDFRGLWVDERVDKGGWNMNNPIDKFQYKIWKYKERILLKYCDQLIILTKKVLPEVKRLGANPERKITIIPCCADYEHFKIFSESSRRIIKSDLDIPLKSVVLGYLGSVGSMYRPDAYIELLKIYQKTNLRAFGLVVTPDKEIFIKIMKEKCTLEQIKSIKIVVADRDTIPKLIACMDILVAFTNPSYAKISMSPTKLGEAFASGVPVLCNSGVGDVDTLINEIGAGLVIPNLSLDSLNNAASKIKNLIDINKKDIRTSSERKLSLKIGWNLYNNVYGNLNSL